MKRKVKESSTKANFSEHRCKQSKNKLFSIFHSVSHCGSNLMLRMDGLQLLSQFLLREKKGSTCAVPPEKKRLTVSRACLLMQAAFVKVLFIVALLTDKY